MTAPRVPLPERVVQQQCKQLGLPTVGGQCARLAATAERERHPYLGYLEALLAAELEDRDQRAIARRIKEAHLPRFKTLEEFDFAQAPHVSAARLQALAAGDYVDRAEPVVFLGDCGTGKTHLLTGLCVAACRQKRRVRFITAAALVNELSRLSSRGSSGGPWRAGPATTCSASTRWATCRWPSSAPSSSSRSSPSGLRRRPCYSRPTSRSRNGRR